jgi:hypothetical protein
MRSIYKGYYFLSHTPYPLKGPTRLRTPLILKGVNALIWILKPNARRFPLGKKRRGKDVPVPFGEKKGAGEMMIFFAHPLSTRLSGFRHPMRAGSLQGKEGRGRDDDLLSHTPYPLKGPTRLRTPLILKGVNPPIRIRHLTRAGSL